MAGVLALGWSLGLTFGCGSQLPPGGAAPAPSVTAEPPSGKAPGWLGVELEPATAGVRVVRVVAGSPAQAAGLAKGDVIVRFGSVSVAQPQDVAAEAHAIGAGERASIVVQRHGRDRLLAVVLKERPNDDALMQRAYVGQRAPDFEGLVGVQGSVPKALGAYQGRVVLLEFWADWCNVCRLLVPTLERWHARFAGQGVEILAVTTDPIEVAVRSTLEQRLSYAVAADPRGKTTTAYRAFGLPSLYVIDQQGVVRELMIGIDPSKLRDIEGLVEQLLAEPFRGEP